MRNSFPMAESLLHAWSCHHWTLRFALLGHVWREDERRQLERRIPLALPHWGPRS